MTPESSEQWRRTMKSALQCGLLDRARVPSELIAVMHLQIIEAGEGLNRRYVAHHGNRPRELLLAEANVGSQQTATLTFCCGTKSLIRIDCVTESPNVNAMPQGPEAARDLAVELIVAPLRSNDET